MEAQAEPKDNNATAPAYEAWPSVPKSSLKTYHPNDESSVMDIDTDTRDRRATSVISMDDIEAAQALEGLRAGTCTSCSCVLHRLTLNH